MGVLDGNSKQQPLHYGEINDIWSFSMKAKGCISTNRAFLNHAEDKELKGVLKDIINQAELEASECDSILIANGIVPFPAWPERPEAKFEDIPVGARFSDQEIAAMAGADTSLGLVACSQVMGMSIREDIGALFGKYHMTKAALGLKILKMCKDKGWIVPPPLQLKRPELVEV